MPTVCVGDALRATELAFQSPFALGVPPVNLREDVRALAERQSLTESDISRVQSTYAHSYCLMSLGSALTRVLYACLHQTRHLFSRGETMTESLCVLWQQLRTCELEQDT